MGDRHLPGGFGRILILAGRSEEAVPILEESVACARAVGPRCSSGSPCSTWGWPASRWATSKWPGSRCGSRSAPRPGWLPGGHGRRRSPGRRVRPRRGSGARRGPVRGGRGSEVVRWRAGVSTGTAQSRGRRRRSAGPSVGRGSRRGSPKARRCPYRRLLSFPLGPESSVHPEGLAWSSPITWVARPDLGQPCADSLDIHVIVP